MKALINCLQGIVKATRKMADLEKRIDVLENEKVLRSRLEHRIGVLEAQWENRDT